MNSLVRALQRIRPRRSGACGVDCAVDGSTASSFDVNRSLDPTSWTSSAWSPRSSSRSMVASMPGRSRTTCDGLNISRYWVIACFDFGIMKCLEILTRCWRAFALPWLRSPHPRPASSARQRGPIPGPGFLPVGEGVNGIAIDSVPRSHNLKSPRAQRWNR